ncbi:Crp/Fnr family transcriptional regulator [Synechococcus sp. OH2]|uniref:Crp/Fnr family transcriptional regulator n=1 Tax=Synechococcus sp. OH2 TaxID=136798 RepID=UPI0039C27CF3
MSSTRYPFERVRDHLLFQSLADAEWKALTAALLPSRFSPGQVIFQEGDPSSDLYVVLSGIVELRRQYMRYPGDYWLATLHAGRVFGELSLLTGRRRSFTAVSLTEVQTLRLSSEGLLLLPLEVQVKLYRAWIQIIGERLFWLDSMFADLLEQRGAENVASAMALLQQRYPA